MDWGGRGDRGGDPQLVSRARGALLLSSPNYLPDPSGYMSAGMNKALAFIRENLTQPFGEADLAAIASQSQSAFSRSFRRHTGMSLVQYVKRLRINLACQILMSDEQASITDICFEVGFNSLGTFSRTFHEIVGATPIAYRAQGGPLAVPTCFTMAWMRPSSFGEARSKDGA